MKVSVAVAREEMRRLLAGGAKFDWKENSLHGSWLTFDIDSVYIDHVETICNKISDDWVYEIDSINNKAHFELFDITKENTVEKKTIFKVRQWLTRRNDNPIPMRTMEGVIVKETSKAYQVKLNGLLKPSKQCLHCGRTLTHPVSVLYGIGPVCGGHFHINPCDTKEELEKRYNAMAETMQGVTWEGWIPKSQIESMHLQTV